MAAVKITVTGDNQTVTVRWKLVDVLTKYQLTAYRLARAADVSDSTIYQLVSTKKPPRSVGFEMIAKLLVALREVTGEDVAFGELLEVTFEES
jgi:hypothetical protein